MSQYCLVKVKVRDLTRLKLWFWAATEPPLCPADTSGWDDGNTKGILQ